MRLFVKDQFPKLAFLPALPVRVWSWLCLSVFVVMIGHLVGAWLLGWWAYSADIGFATMMLFILLGLTPLDFKAPRVFYLARPVGSHIDWTPISRLDVWRLRKCETIEIHRVWWANGEVIHGERIK